MVKERAYIYRSTITVPHLLVGIFIVRVLEAQNIRTHYYYYCRGFFFKKKKEKLSNHHSE